MNRSISLLLFLTILTIARPGFGQSCNPVAVSYIVRDETGKVLTTDELKSVAEQLPRQIGDATTSVSEISFAPDNKSYYWSESTEWPNGTKVPSLLFSNEAVCAMHFSEITLRYKARTMRLIFDLDLPRYQPDRRPVVDSLPLQTGTFRLDLKGWAHEKDKMIPAIRWKRLRLK
ncbi:MAG TPA: hypothetical protein VIV66_19770 [Pyrinomonadaceae bacterium]